MITITKVGVIGSGIMGSQIVAHLANAGLDVVLLDMVPEGAAQRDQLALQALERMKKANPAVLTHPRNIKRITIGNIEDDIELLKSCQWIVEAVVEDIEVKRTLYKKIDRVRRPNSIVSSNTSTIPVKALVEGMTKPFQQDFIITHFFNPPRYMPLLEMVTTNRNRKEIEAEMEEFAEKILGKGVVHCKDTPGFIANRIGSFWMTLALRKAIEMDISVEVADAVLSKPFGVPKTGVFGLMDLVGIDLMPKIAKSLLEYLPDNDHFHRVYENFPLVTNMIETGYIGRKGKGGFYRLHTDGDIKEKEAVNLQTGEYAPAKKVNMEIIDQAKKNVRLLLTSDEKASRFAYEVMIPTLAYASRLVPEAADSIDAIDKAMRLGYNWKWGPFQLIDKLSTDTQSGAAWLAEQCTLLGMAVPENISAVGTGHFYHDEGRDIMVFSGPEQYHVQPVPDYGWTLADKKRGAKPLLKNGSASLWDVGDGVVCLEFTSKMNSLDPMVLELIQKSIALVKDQQYKGLIIGNDSDNFCVGANIGVLLFTANVAAWKMVDDVIKQGQSTYQSLKYAPFPVVTAASGMALGGGCEMLLHSDAAVVHMETYTGLVEVGVGIIPGWGGCTEMLVRHQKMRLKEQSTAAALGRMFSRISLVKTVNMMPAITKVFEYIATAKVSTSAEEAKEMGILRDSDKIVMNRQHVLAEAKAKCLALAPNYKAPEPDTLSLPGKTARTALHMGIQQFERRGKATPHDVVVSKALAYVLSGGDTDITKQLSEQQVLDLERAAFLELIQTPASLARLEHMLDVGKPLRN
ncbi:MAG: enoyl-CoA hydratase/isomerase family protein [Alphaproteobacteria bacterium]|nr:enoyl-CoA hydratase/isomerase family protein [Alphaproteobacteria bacterium]